METRPILDPDEWRVASTAGFKCFATDADLSRWLNEGLPKSWGPFGILGEDHYLADLDSEIIHRPFECDLADLVACVFEANRRWFSVWSGQAERRASIRGRITEPSGAGPIHGLSGGIRVDRGAQRAPNPRVPSGISYTPWVENRRTGDRIVSGYKGLYHILRHRAMKDLCYATLIQLPDGTTGELRDYRWTEDAARSHAAGTTTFATWTHPALPGRRLTPELGSCPKHAASA